MTAIAARAGASIGSLYEFFPTKDQIAGALLKKLCEHAPGNVPQAARDRAVSGITAACEPVDQDLCEVPHDPSGIRGLGRDLQ